jgi:CRISPR-associated endonuclease/helicase Cas3
MLNDSKSYTSFWGKARLGDSPDFFDTDWHPAAFHMLDVAAVALTWLTRITPIVPGIGKDARKAWPTIVTLIALHDIGKFSLPFQSRRPDLWPACLGPLKTYASPRHDTAGYGFLKRPAAAPILHRLCGTLRPADINVLLRAVSGHHGSPPVEDAYPSHTFNDAARDAALAFMTDLLALLNPPSLPEMGEDAVTAFSWWLAGLTVLADWIGSNETWFPYQRGAKTLAKYWPEACQRAQLAVAMAGIDPIAPSAVSPRALLLGGDTATPMQDFVSGVSLGPADAPSLVIIEDQTGSGKTEAALILTHRLMVEKNARGVFIALPTMATANALHGRLSENYRTLFAPGTDPSLVLAHGKRNLNDRFAEAMARAAVISENVNADADETASAQCAAWIGQDRRRAFLAHCGVGTIDQALHGVLPTRHAPLRLFGLSQRVLLIDEAHAYDSYMIEEMLRLIAFQAGLGGSTIILSATLPFAMRRLLVDTFNKATTSAEARLESNAYPLITLASAGAAVEHGITPRPGLQRSLTVHRLADEDAAITTIESATRRGAAVAWIRNAVDDAVAAHAALKARGVDAILFHARFAMGDRLAIEERVQAMFGKDSGRTERACVVVGTQVMEQSLDIDFDVMVSDIAPVDLLLQRAGRLWRHPHRERPESAPCLFVVAPEPVPDPAANWLLGFRRTARVYEDHGVLWRTARAIFAKPKIEIPEDVRRLVEHVYAPDAPVPAALMASADKARAANSAARAIAWQNLLTWQEGYAHSGGAWASDVRTPTRLGDSGIVYRIGIWRDGRIDPCCVHGDKSWAMSEINLPTWRVKGVLPETGARSAATQSLRDGWNRWEKEIPVLILDRDGAGSVLDSVDRPRHVRYNLESGLVFTT